jgi:DNA-binding response OmpR family regulator
MNPENPINLLVVDDKGAMRGLLADYFSEKGYNVSTAQDGELALAAVRNHSPNVILLDLMMPRMDGFEFLRRFRTLHSTPVIVITAKEAEEDAVQALELGADDFVNKPVRLKELDARITAVIRRHQPKSDLLTYEKLTLNTSTLETKVGGELIKLTPTEFELLKTMLKASPGVVAKEKLIAELASIGIDSLDSTLKVHIRNLRQKLNEAQSDVIDTVFGVGYRIGHS